MPKDTKTLGNSKARACESLGFVHKKGCARVLTQPLLLRFLADSNRRTRFCRPLTKPLIQGTSLFSFAVAKVAHFLKTPTIRSIFSSFLFSWRYTLHASHPSIALSHNRLRNLHMDYHFLLSGGKKHKFPIRSGQYTTVTGLQPPIVANSSYK